MDPVTILAITVAAAGGSAATWLLMTVNRLRERLNANERALADQAQAQRELSHALAGEKAATAQLKTENDDLRRRTWPANLNLDQRAWLASVETLAEIAAQDQLDALMRLSPEAVQRVVRKIAPHLYERENIK